MNARELYEKETGNVCPTNQIAYHEWSIQYMQWLENKIVELYPNINISPEDYFKIWSENCRIFQTYQPIHSHEDMMKFAKDYHEFQVKKP